MKYDFVMQGSFFAHRALLRDTQMLHSMAERMDSFSKDQVKEIRKWYQFYWNMMEIHHQAEDDILFSAVEKRMNQPSEIIEAMEVEHNRLQFLTDEIKRLLGEAERSTVLGNELKTSLSRHTLELLELFSSHIAKEEKYIHEWITMHFSPKDQRNVERQVRRKAPTSYLSYMIPWLHDSLSEEEKRKLDLSLPWMAKALNRFLWQRKYEKISQPVKALMN